MYKCDPSLAARVQSLRKSLLDSKYRVSGHVLTGEILTSIVDTLASTADYGSDNPTVGARLTSSMLAAYLFFSTVSSVSVKGSRITVIVNGEDTIQYLSSRGVSFYFQKDACPAPDQQPAYFLFFSPAQFVDMIFRLFDLNSARYVYSSKKSQGTFL